MILSVWQRAWWCTRLPRRRAARPRRLRGPGRGVRRRRPHGVPAPCGPGPGRCRPGRPLADRVARGRARRMDARRRGSRRLIRRDACRRPVRNQRLGQGRYATGQPTMTASVCCPHDRQNRNALGRSRTSQPRAFRRHRYCVRSARALRAASTTPGQKDDARKSLSGLSLPTPSRASSRRAMRDSMASASATETRV